MGLFALLDVFIKDLSQLILALGIITILYLIIIAIDGGKWLIFNPKQDTVELVYMALFNIITVKRTILGKYSQFHSVSRELRIRLRGRNVKRGSSRERVNIVFIIDENSFVQNQLNGLSTNHFQNQSISPLSCIHDSCGSDTKFVDDVMKYWRANKPARCIEMERRYESLFYKQKLGLNDNDIYTLLNGNDQMIFNLCHNLLVKLINKLLNNQLIGWEAACPIWGQAVNEAYQKDVNLMINTYRKALLQDKLFDEQAITIALVQVADTILPPYRGGR